MLSLERKNKSLSLLLPSFIFDIYYPNCFICSNDKKCPFPYISRLFVVQLSTFIPLLTFMFLSILISLLPWCRNLKNEWPPPLSLVKRVTESKEFTMLKICCMTQGKAINKTWERMYDPEGWFNVVEVIIFREIVQSVQELRVIV